MKIYIHRNQFSILNALDGKDQVEVWNSLWKKRIVTNKRAKREKQARGVGVHRDRAKGMNEHALWADLEEMVEVKEAVLVEATLIKPELRRHTDSQSLVLLRMQILYATHYNIILKSTKSKSRKIYNEI